MNDQDKDKILKELFSNPPTIGIIGLSGTGKSSTINAMFKTNLPISHTTGCTKSFDENNFVFTKRGPIENQKISLRVYDAPGLGESQLKDPGFLKQYRENLPKCDVILWTLSARNRALALDQQYLQELSEFSGKIIFGLNQVDLVEPRNWHPKMPMPTPEMKKYIDEIVVNRQERIQEVLGKKVTIIPYSNYRKYNLATLFEQLISNCPTGRKWIFQSLLGLTLDDIEKDFEELKKEHNFISEPNKILSDAEINYSPEPKPTKPSLPFRMMNKLLGRRDTDKKPQINSLDEIKIIENWIIEQKKIFFNN